MTDVTITVRGENEARIAPERATIHITVRAEGAQRAPVVDLVMRLAEPVRTSITDRKDAGTVLEWTSKRLAVRAERPWNNEGKRLAPVFYGGISLTATFAEASELSIWVSEVSAWDGVEIGWVDWQLTPETRARVEREVASEAVGVAVARAQAYAGALGLKEVTPREIADVGLIARAESAAPPSMKMRGAAFASADSAASMEYEPEEIVVAATVEARFIAR
ncbi:SIMPL domain-containing protein [Microbacterium aurantiacum]|uniref:SIMPL domain-containing protein n=1 Tax=Microbacterium aurantiacum TaxID=162393 RepID=UPI000C809080|nr:SIMPL domain-containing protein [Microbacterium aurantiacum]